MRKIVLGFLFLVCTSLVFTQQKKYPETQGWMNDFADVIDTRYENEIKQLARELQEKTTVQIVIVTVTSLEGIPLETYAEELFQQWGIGQKGKDNGLLYLLAVNERKIRIEVGDGLEGIITDGTAGEIRDRYIIPNFSKGDFGRGFLQASAAAAGIIAEDSGVKITGQIKQTRSRRSSGRVRNRGVSLLYFLPLLIIILIVFSIVVPRLEKGNEDKKGKNQNSEISSDQSNMKIGGRMTTGNFEFTGKGSSYLWLLIWSNILIVLTAGLFWPWAYCAQQKWIAERTRIDGKQLVFKGTGMGIFGTYLLIIILTIITLGLYAPWAYCRIKRWQVNNLYFAGHGDVEKF